MWCFWGLEWQCGGGGSEAPQKCVARWGGAPQKISATFTLKKWSKTPIFSSNWHSALVNSSHLRCSSMAMSAWNPTELEDLMSDTLHHTFLPWIKPYNYLTKHTTAICTKRHDLRQALYFWSMLPPSVLSFGRHMHEYKNERLFRPFDQSA